MVTGRLRSDRDRTEVDIDRVHELLSASYWASGRSRETIDTIVENSISIRTTDAREWAGS
jgi:hypothetical protein